MGIIRRFAAQVLPDKVYLSLGSIYIRMWEQSWRLGLTEATMGDICRNERCVEYAWALRNIGSDSRTMLDVGCKGSLFPVLLASTGQEVWGVDMFDIGRYKNRHPNFRFVKGDIRTVGVPENYFDVITMISTIEHVGLNDDGDFEGMNRLISLLKTNGQIILTTPYGRAANFKTSRVYDNERLAKLFEGLKIKKTSFFKELDPGKWLPADENEVEGFLHTSERARAIACVVASKDG